MISGVNSWQWSILVGSPLPPGFVELLPFIVTHQVISRAGAQHVVGNPEGVVHNSLGVEEQLAGSEQILIVDSVRYNTRMKSITWRCFCCMAVFLA